MSRAAFRIARARLIAVCALFLGAPGAAAVAQDGDARDDDARDDDARAEALADEIMTAMGYDVTADNIPSTFADATARSMTSCNPETPPKEVETLRSILEEELTAAVPAYLARIRDSYVRRLTLEELEALAAFYRSPEGEGVAEAASVLVYDQFVAQLELDRAGLLAYQRLGWCTNGL